MLRLRRYSLLALLLASPSACSPTPGAAGATHFGATQPGTVASGATIARGADLITADDMYGRIYFLSADALRGRDTPSPGLEAAAAYLVSEHRRMGLEPAGESSTYYQRYPFRARGAPPSAPPSFPPNVVSVLRGSDPVLRDEYVVLSAHFDHVGVGTPVNGDSIYNGADDNGSGTAALLEVAKAFASLPERPRRSIVFLHVSGEEHGLLGSRWFSENPTVPLDRIVANLNVDMIGRNAPDSIVVIGKRYSTLGDLVERLGERHHADLGLAVADDPWPQERFFFRSDHLNFARQGIPAIFFFAGVHEDYHRPSDTVDKIDADKAARVARLIFHTAAAIAADTQRPEWDPAGLAEVRAISR